MCALLLITVAAGFVAVDRYELNSRLGDLVEQEGGWREDYDEFQEAFPQLVETAIVVVSGGNLENVDAVAKSLEAAITAEDQLFVDVYAPGNDSFFTDNALLYMDLDQLDQVSNELAQAQPILSAVARDPRLESVLQLAVDGASDEPRAGYEGLISRLLESARAANEGEDSSISWRDEFLGSRLSEGSDSHYRLIFLRGKPNFGVALPNAQVVARLRQIIEEIRPADNNHEGVLRIALTGEVALRHDEVQAATSGVKLSGSVALVLLAAVLAYGVRSVRIVAAIFAVLIVGGVWTAAWAMLAIGSFNTLSLVFLVMFFGLGVDFCLHYCLRVQEVVFADEPAAVQGKAIGQTAQPEVKRPATVLPSATLSVGGAVLLCTLTTAIGFLGFVPTAYKGLADLGVISAGGMVVASVLTFTLLPALFAIFGLPQKKSIQLRSGGAVVSWLVAHKVLVLGLLAVLLAGCLWLLPRMSFDYSVLALRDPGAESMRALRELQSEGQITDYALYTLTPPEQLAEQKALQNLDTVDRVITPLDYLPAEQDEKLFALEDLQELLGGSLSSSARNEEVELEIEAKEIRQSVIDAAVELRSKATTLSAEDLRDSLAALATELERVVAGSDTSLLAWQADVIDPLLTEMNWLDNAIQAESLEFSDLPTGLRERLVASDGRYLSAILPSEDITPVAALNRFIDSVRGEIPNATGRPVIEWGVGNIVLDSFKTALAVALGGISLVLLIALRNLTSVLLVLAPLVLSAVFTVATSVLLAVPVNMASVLVLPLIFGLGVDNGIHMVERFRSESRNVRDFMSSSTPRAVLLSTLTTIGTFAALMLSSHAGTASIGFLLTVAVGYLLLFTVFGLPLLLSLTDRGANVTTR